MRHFSIWLAFITLFATAAWAEPKCELGKPKKPLIEEPLLYLYSADGPVAAHRNAYVLANCWNDAPRLKGLVDANGKLLVPAIYNNVIPLSPTMAAVQPSIPVKLFYQPREPYLFYVYGKGEKGKVPWQFMTEHVWQDVRYPLAWNGEGAVPEYFALAKSWENPVHIRNLGGSAYKTGSPTLERRDGTLIVHFTAADGTAVSRILDLKGEPISPVLGAIERWESYADMQAYHSRNRNAPKQPSSVEYIATSLIAQHPALPYGKLYTPIDSNGGPLPLPGGVIGVFPLKIDARPDALRETQGWALAEETPQGLRLIWGQGSLQSVVDNFANLPMATGMVRYIDRMNDRNAFIKDVFAIRSADEDIWRLYFYYNFKPQPEDAPLASGQQARATYDNYVDERMSYQRNLITESARKAEEGRRAAYASGEANYQKLLAEGKLCGQSKEVYFELHVPGLERVLRECSIPSDVLLNFAQSKGVSAEVLAEARFKYYKAKGHYEPRIPAAPPGSGGGVNWNSWGDAIIKSSKESTNSFIRENRQQQYQNLENWNRGKQNWCC